MTTEKKIDVTGRQYVPTVSIHPAGLTITQTTLAVTASSQTLIAANTNRRYLAWMIIGTADVTISPASPVVVATGLIYQAAGAGKQGASQEWISNAPQNAFYAIAAATGSTVVIWEGV